jgi:hypothetical protein
MNLYDSIANHLRSLGVPTAHGFSTRFVGALCMVRVKQGPDNPSIRFQVTLAGGEPDFSTWGDLSTSERRRIGKTDQFIEQRTRRKARRKARRAEAKATKTAEVAP